MTYEVVLVPALCSLLLIRVANVGWGVLAAVNR